MDGESPAAAAASSTLMKFMKFPRKKSTAAASFGLEIASTSVLRLETIDAGGTHTGASGTVSAFIIRSSSSALMRPSLSGSPLMCVVGIEAFSVKNGSSVLQSTANSSGTRMPS